MDGEIVKVAPCIPADDPAVAELKHHSGQEYRAYKLVEPTLMLKSDRRLSMAAHQQLQNAFAQWQAGGKLLILEPGMTFYQKVDGRWQPIDPRDLPLIKTEDRPVSDIADEFGISLEKLAERDR